MVPTNNSHVPPPHGIQIVRGSSYGVFSRAFVEFVVSNWRAKDLLEWLRETYRPDEYYWSTLHHLYYNPQLLTPGGYPGESRITAVLFSVNLTVMATLQGIEQFVLQRYRDTQTTQWLHGVMRVRVCVCRVYLVHRLVVQIS